MDVRETMENLGGALKGEGDGWYRFACPKAVLLIRPVGSRTHVQFRARDHVGFRVDQLYLCVEDLGTKAVRMRFRWDSIESIAAGEPECENSELFQG